MSMLSLTFVHSRVRHRLQSRGVRDVRTGFMGFVGAKLSLVTTLNFDDHIIRLCVSHMEAGSDTLKRQETIKDLYTEFCHPTTSDVFMLFGDLNLRTHASPEQYQSIVGEGFINDPHFDETLLLQFDEVAMGHSPILEKKFIEGPIAFPPTYKIDRASEEPRYKSNRDASWTDRVFTWTTNQKNIAIKYHKYSSLSFTSSDHR